MVAEARSEPNIGTSGELAREGSPLGIMSLDDCASDRQVAVRIRNRPEKMPSTPRQLIDLFINLASLTSIWHLRREPYIRPVFSSIAA